jgi:hypothetical protein
MSRLILDDLPDGIQADRIVAIFLKGGAFLCGKRFQQAPPNLASICWQDDIYSPL